MRMGDRAYLLVLGFELGNSKRQLMLLALPTLGTTAVEGGGLDAIVRSFGLVDGDRLTGLLAGQGELRRA